MTKNLTEGNPLKLIVGFAVPVLFGLLFQQLYNMVDTMIVGKILGPEALAAVGSTGSIMFLIVGFCMGICSGFAIPMSQAFGAGDENALKKYIANTLWLCLIFGLILTVSTGLLCKQILIWMDTPEEILEDAYRYIVVIFWGIPAMILYNMLSGMIRAVGDSKTPVCFLALSSALNIVLDVILITVFQMGVAGASVATIIAQGVSGVLCLLYIRKKFPILQPAGRQWRWDGPYAGRLCGMGIPMGLQYSITAIGSVILQTAVNGLGTMYVATVTAGSKIALMFACPFDALGTTIATYAGQNIGAGKPGRIRQGVTACVLLGFGFTVAVIAIFYFLGGPLTLLFVDAENEEIIVNSRIYLIWNAVFYFALTGVNVFRFCIQGMGHSQIAIIAGVFEMFARAIMGAVFVPVFGFMAAVLSGPAAWIAADLFLIPCYRSLIRKTERRMQERMQGQANTHEAAFVQQ